MIDIRKLGLFGCALLLTGCVGGTKNVAPVVDRSYPRTPPAPAYPTGGPIESVPVTGEVTVRGIDDEPIQSVQQPVQRPSVRTTTTNNTDEATGTGNSWVTARAAERTYQVNPAVVALLDNARQQSQRGAYSAAASTLERAQRIAPREPEVYYEMARVRQKSGSWTQAEQLALKGVQHAAGADTMLKKLWLLIADIRTDAGDQTGAQRARLKARRY